VPAVLTLSFDPVLRLSETASIRVETAVLAAVLLGGLLLAVRVGNLARPADLRIDDLVFMVVGAVPGAIVGGRAGYVLDHLAFYQANPSLITDPAQGGFTLTLAVPLGMLSGAIIGRLLGAPIGRWMHALALPLLFALGAGKLAGVLGGTGQGLPTDAAWATAYAGPGPWGSLAADLPSHPSQVYEAALVGLVMLAFWPLSRVRPIARRNGAAIWVAVALWCVVRFAVAFTWRDPAVFGGLGSEQLLALAVGALAVGGVLERSRSAVVTAAAQSDPSTDIQTMDEAPSPTNQTGESSEAPASVAEPAPAAAESLESAGSPDVESPGSPDVEWREPTDAEGTASATAGGGATDPETPEPNAETPEPADGARRSRRRTRGRVS